MAKKKAVEALLTKYKKGHNEYAEISDVAKEFIDVWKRMTTISEESIATAKMILKLTSIIEEMQLDIRSLGGAVSACCNR